MWCGVGCVCRVCGRSRRVREVGVRVARCACGGVGRCGGRGWVVEGVGSVAKGWGWGVWGECV